MTYDRREVRKTDSLLLFREPLTLHDFSETTY
jgi:hypothetical protein